MTQEERDAAEQRLYERVKQSGGKILSDEAYESYKNRIERHLMQQAKDVSFAGEETGESGNVRLFGSRREIMPPEPGGAWTIEAPFSLYSQAKSGKISSKEVTLRVWSDQRLDRSIELNLNMAKAVSDDNLKKDLKIEITTVTVIMWMRLRGQFFWLQQPMKEEKDPNDSMFFDNKDRRLYRIMTNDFRTWFHAHSGISPANERMWKQVFEGIKTASTNPDIANGVTPGNLFFRKGDVIYLSCGASKMVRVSKDSVKEVDNGTDGVVFALGQTLAPWELLDRDEGKNPFQVTQVFGSANYASRHGRTILTLWFLALAACIKNYPIILFHGRYRSGKTRIAQAVFELLGVKVDLNSIQENGQEDFWAILNPGGVVCFDNVDGRIVRWFPNDIQIASTGGSKTKRKMYTDKETVNLGANAKIMLTANDPKFMADSGISDRVLNIQLLPFTGGKVTKDSELTEEITNLRSSAFTWMAYTLSRALAIPDDAINKNINKRHPDFARFVLRIASALGVYDDAVSAMVYAEMNKSYQTIITDRVTQMIFEVVRDRLMMNRDAICRFTSKEMLEQIKLKFSEQLDEYDRAITNLAIGKVMSKHLDEFRVMFKTTPPKVIHGITHYTFAGFTDEYHAIVSELDKNDDKRETIENTENADVDDIEEFNN